MEEIRDLIGALVRCVPPLDPAPLRERLPASTEQGEVLDWLMDHLEPQGLFVYEEWKEYFGEVPALRLIADLDLPDYNEDLVYGLMEGAGEDANWALAAPDERPFFEYLNAALRPHGWRVVDLLPFENAYILCVKDDDEAIAELDRCFQAFGMHVNPREPMGEQAARAHVQALLAS